ncbi:zinc-binding dehydrogenase [Leptospira sp. 2 VSF19]|uniref:Zinc-binding dehydrogenase n=1 Tax=Leptospira soteropolitanensis TaxID=2950025 RepID=A0AAW5VAU7_9LEPT|nr:zinc-binding dehydrogenase [Leptospira soteropolitanensis]MCW7491372.1 zinc-binding dehydrogenase [Leptospira soteropolitanensis]MCW7498957.1 zinc-binding dehydrogenase [Leptospira soteropolitanensis]MCW7521451.1 zinc-binding dehydrogenase [Leptospira soteropolitanensis]MCW7525060.1 zinc-binding dehydrogenase [Leptospira soteropolitanensis]MCW7528928.1 zinc-binding dehydrogenase [Leptospira soteropolitanensis]
MKAAVLPQGSRSLEIQDLDLPSLLPNQVKIKVKACGICGSDIHLVLHGKMKATYTPCVPGHETSGVVEEVGEQVTRFKKGDRVVVSAGTSCGKCKHCLAGRENLCEEIGVLGFNQRGGFAEYLQIEERYLHNLPDEIPFTEGAILADAVSTPYHAVKYQGEIKPGDTVAIIGCGGLGIHAVAIAKALGAGRIFAVDIDSGSLENAKSYGADELILVEKNMQVGKVLKEKSGGIDLLCDFSGFMPNIENSVRAMNRGGRIVLVGIGRNKLEIPMPFFLIERQIRITGSYGSDRRAIPELIQLYKDKKLSLTKSISGVHKLEETNEFLHALEEKKGNPIRFIINPEL